MSDQQPEPELTLQDIRAELSDVGKALLDQAIGSAQRAKRLRAELAAAQNASAPTSPRTVPGANGDPVAVPGATDA